MRASARWLYADREAVGERGMLHRECAELAAAAVCAEEHEHACEEGKRDDAERDLVRFERKTISQPA